MALGTLDALVVLCLQPALPKPHQLPMHLPFEDHKVPRTADVSCSCHPEAEDFQLAWSFARSPAWNNALYAGGPDVEDTVQTSVLAGNCCGTFNCHCRSRFRNFRSSKHSSNGTLRTNTCKFLTCSCGCQLRSLETTSLPSSL